jgi:hypothetical protein
MAQVRFITMRKLVLSLGILTLGAPAVAAQPYGSVVNDPAYQAQQQMDRQQAIALENRLNALDARVESERRLREFLDTLPPPNISSAELPAATVQEDYAAIPDTALAESNERVKAVSKNPR